MRKYLLHGIAFLVALAVADPASALDKIKFP
jgi:hypothetical protein